MPYASQTHSKGNAEGGSADLQRTTGPLTRCLIAALLAAGLAATTGCGKSYVRGEEQPQLDEMTMSLRFDRTDIQKLYSENVSKLMNSKIVETWKQMARDGEPPVVAISPIRNETSEHIRKPLNALASKFETDLVNQLPVDVVAYERQEELIADVKGQQAATFNPNRIAEYGKQLGAQYFVTGRVYDVAERTDKARRVQYFMFIQVLNVETGGVVFQSESSVTKALIG